MKNFARHTGIAALFAAAVTLAPAAFAEQGVSSDKIVFGQSAALEGPASALGLGMKAGILAAFEEANRAGGVNGRKLELKSVNDNYEPEAAIANTKALIEQDQVFALIGAVGTPTSKATQPIATDAKVPFIGPFTGAGFLRAPELTNVVNVRASYGAETETWIQHLTTDLGYSRVAILYQDDSFGRAGYDGVIAALKKRNMSLVAEGKYERNTVAVKSAVLDIKAGDPQAVVIVGAYKPSAEFTKLAKKVGMNATFVNISFVGSDALAKELGPDGEGVVITQVVPFPWDTSIPVVAQYQAALKASDAAATPGFVSLEGYIVGRLTIEALKKAGAEPTRDGILKAIYDTKTFDIGGVKLTFGPGDNQGFDDVFLTLIGADGSFKSVKKLGVEG